MAQEPRCIFYRTLPMVDDPIVGSDVRPAKLLKAFRQLGYDVEVVAGKARDRRRAADAVKRRILAGEEFEFLYAEPPTTPVLLNEPHHLPTHPLLDYQFLTFCRSRGIPIILFYCDVQWRLPEYVDRIGWWKYLAAFPFFHLDLLMYRRLVDALLVPDAGMLPQIADWAAEKPNWTSIPGFDPQEMPPPRQPVAPDAPLRFLYVGGVTPPVYDITPILEGSMWASNHGLSHEVTICCREAEWLRRLPAYERLLNSHVKVVHNRNRRELFELYSRHDIAVMPYGTPNSDWAMPVKFSEAIGMGLPILAGNGTAVAARVTQQNIGWSIGASSEDFGGLLLRVDRAELDRVRANIKVVRPTYAWLERAREVVAIAKQLRATPKDLVPVPVAADATVPTLN